MSTRSQAKLYVSRGVQTEDSLLLQLPPSDTHLRSSLDCRPAGELATPVDALSPVDMHSRILGALAYEGAYTHCQILDDPEPLPLASSSSKNQRYPGLGFNRPLESYSASKRVVSLPDPSVQEAVITERNLRIVSMPEFTKFHPLNDSTSLQPSQATNSSFSSDVSRHSVESADQRWPLTHHKMHPMDIPQTPSPPSSPDSVVIIGQVPHLSGAFLRPACTDSDGWVTWATSPPRPIPALHGPLSLPYARCPSGAEGTVIEGDDLTHKIWGLGTGETPMNAHISKVGAHQQQPVLAYSQTNVTSQNPPHLAFPHQRLGDDVIDLSVPSTFYAGLPGYSERVISSSHCAQPHNASDIGLRGENSIHKSRVGDPGVKRYQLNNSPGLTDNSRIGSDFPVPMTQRGASLSGGPLETRLNKAAPIFIPSTELNSKGAYIQQKENTTSALDHQYSRRAGLSQHRHVELLTPPSTSSPHWSPVFCQSMNIGLSRGSYGPGDPKIYSPRAELDDYSNKLMSMIQQIKQQDFINSTKRFSVNSTRQREPLAQKNSAVNDACQWREEQPQSISGKANTLHPSSSDFRRDLSQQHPRSIPLARLIQRRLSSVAEEDGSESGYSTIPFMQTVDPRASLGPLIYRSHTDQLGTAIPIEAFVPVSSSQPSNETKDVQSGDLKSNAIVRLPRRSPISRVHRPSNDLLSKRPLHDDTKKDKKDIVNAQEDTSKAEETIEKGKHGQKKRGNSGKLGR